MSSSREERRTRTLPCADCGRERRVEGRGLCGSCYARNRHGGTLARFPCRQVPAADLVEDYEFLARDGYTRAAAAEYMGISKKRLEKAIERTSRRLAEAS